MCMEDIAIWRNTKTKLYTTQGNVNIPSNANRLSVRVVAGANEQAILSVAFPNVAAGTSPQNFIIGQSFTVRDISGLLIGVTLPDDVTLAKIGDILLGPLVLSSQGGADVFAIETYLDCPTDKPKGCI